MKRWMSILLTCLMLIVLCPATLMAQEEAGNSFKQECLDEERRDFHMLLTEELFPGVTKGENIPTSNTLNTGYRYVYESEPNDQLWEANIVTHNDIVSGDTSGNEGYDIDMYRFEVVDHSLVTILCAADVDGILINLFDGDGRDMGAIDDMGLIDGFFYDGNICELFAGSYYFKLQDIYAGWYDEYITYAFRVEIQSGTHEYTDTIVPPTCTEQGYTLHECYCGDSYQDTYVPAEGHSGQWITVYGPSDTATGLEKRICHCGHVDERVIPENGCVSGDFVDLDISQWYHEHVDYVLEKGLMGSTSTTEKRFDPWGTTTRAMIVTILYRMSGFAELDDLSMKQEWIEELHTNIYDVPAGSWYEEAVAWAYWRGIVNGTGDGTTFSPDDIISREQFATMLYRYDEDLGTAHEKEGAKLSGFPDGDSVSAWAKDAVEWAYAVGIIGGKVEDDVTVLAPAGHTSRVEAATFIHRYDLMLSASDK